MKLIWIKATDKENTGLFRCVVLEDFAEEYYCGAYCDDHQKAYNDDFWAGFMTAKLNQTISDEDIFYYFGSNERVPEVGAEWKMGDMTFKRVK